MNQKKIKIQKILKKIGYFKMINTGTIYQDSALQILSAIKELEKIKKSSRTIHFGKSI